MRLFKFLTGLLAFLLLASGVSALMLSRENQTIAQALNADSPPEGLLVVPAARQPETAPAQNTPVPPKSPLDAALGHSAAADLPSLEAFIASLPGASPQQAVGLYLPGRLAAPIVEQPADDPGWVSPQPNRLTHFRLADNFYVLGLLGHNTLAGAAFFDLQTGDIFFVVYGDGTPKPFIVTEIQKYQALSPASPLSDFIDLQTGLQFSANEVFNRTYGVAKNGLVLQTCIAKGNLSTWGRLFIIARPLGN